MKIPMVAGVALLLVIAAISMFSSRGVASGAVALVNACADSTNRTACYENTVSALYPTHSVADIFDIVREIRREDPSYQFCHVLAHKLGERVVAEDPEKWIDAIPLNPSDGLCSNGFIHGVVGGRFRSEVLDDKTIDTLVPEFGRACESRANWQPSDLDRAICYHGMGHLYDFITNADLSKALSLCSRTVPAEMRRVCVEGVFMQIYQPLEPDDYELIAQMPIKPATTTVRAFCSRFADPMAEGACLHESWPLFRENIMRGDVQSFCSEQPDTTETDRCYEAVSSIIGRQTLGEQDHAIAACAGFPSHRRAECIAYSAQATLEENRLDAAAAIALCKRASGEDALTCLNQLVDHALFIFGNDDRSYSRFCLTLPAELRTQCRDRL